MQLDWIILGIAATCVAAWCAPRASERQALRAYPLSTRLRLLLTATSWRDETSPVDHVLLRNVQRRFHVGALAVIALSVAFRLWPRDEPEPERRGASPVVQSSPVKPARPMITRPRASVPEPAPDPIAEPDPEAVKALRTPTRLYGTAKVKPVYRLHDVEGARITNIGPGSFWDLLGVHEGDVVIELHGDPVDTPADLVALMNVLERDEHVAIAVRGTDGEVRYLDFRIPGEETR